MSKILQASSWVPGARVTSGPYTGGPAKALLHATITPSMSLPGYSAQATAPHETLRWDMAKKRLIPGQHYKFDQFAKALRNLPGGVQTNMDSVLQFELAGYLGANGAKVPAGEFDILTAPDTYWEQVADHIGPVIQSWGIKPVIYPTGNARMTFSQWDNFSGLCTHADAPENDHWDLPIPAGAVAILAKKIWLAPAVVKPPASAVPNLPPKGTTTPPRFPLPSGHVFGPKTGPYWQHSGYYSATDRAGLRVWQAQMRNVRKWTIDVDGLYGDQTGDVTEAFQREKGLKPDRLIGKATWDKAWTAKIT